MVWMSVARGMMFSPETLPGVCPQLNYRQSLAKLKEKTTRCA
jgi:hypothetical protein